MLNVVGIANVVLAFMLGEKYFQAKNCVTTKLTMSYSLQHMDASEQFWTIIELLYMYHFMNCSILMH